ncbi:NAD-dependent epimerase/dehydratase family protein [Streptomyces sp. ISL-100]|uniref:NAD-dependent epimerase/dehydratase family protein n=1 Tax=Streptomyces sp. ISL-100 TaxID=2819173 RepID=UPI0027E45603|nr:NAD-dependent epimerase/dehydratase family protein [Streptomyces sp. ISL-100]
MHDRSSPLSQLSGRTVLITGGGGLIGSRIAKRLRELRARPISLCTLDAYPSFVYKELFGIDPTDPDVIVSDVRDREAVGRILPECDYVVHAAALADVAACTRNPLAAIQANIIGTQVLLDAVAATDRIQRFVHVSSASVYGNGNPDETHNVDLLSMRQILESVYGRIPPQFNEAASPVRPMSVYANTKAWGETQTALTLGAVGTSYTVVRYFSVYGEPQTIKPGSHSWVVAWFATRAALGLPLHLHGGGHQIRDLVHVDDIAEGTLRALVAPQAHTEALNIGTGTPTSVRAVAEQVREHFPNAQCMNTPMPPGDPLGGFASTRRMEDMLGWRPQVTVPEGVDRYVKWMKKTPAAVPDWLRETSQAG